MMATIAKKILKSSKKNRLVVLNRFFYKKLSQEL
jgi:hypothetical protein